MNDVSLDTCVVEKHKCMLLKHTNDKTKHGSWFIRHFPSPNSLLSRHYSFLSFFFIKGTPIEVTLQAGEFEVVKSIIQTSIPYLLGWNATMDLAAAAAISKGVSGGGQFY